MQVRMLGFLAARQDIVDFHAQFTRIFVGK
jgi:hypothetical protein